MFRQMALGAVFSMCSAMVMAQDADSSVRPKARKAADAVSRAIMAPMTLAPARSARPAVRPAGLKPKPIYGNEAAFQRWLRDFRPRALQAGISPGTFDAAFRGVHFDNDVVARDQNQAEFNKTIWDYLDSAASDSRVANGKAALQQHAAVLRQIEARYGVDKQVVVAIWGLESAYGSHRGNLGVVQSMASLAYEGRRTKFFESQLIAALTILQRGDTTPARMKGSWAGAMGHTQFMPTSFTGLAVDFTGDGRRDIWGEDPSDALASTANYLSSRGWVKGMPWGVEVSLPKGFDHSQANGPTKRMPSDWARLGVVGMDGKAVRDFGTARLLLPAGYRGAAFLVFKNFDVIKRYNPADAYALGVGHLGDRITGAAPFRSGWPREDRALTRDERKELQQRLTAAGFSTGGVDGRIGPNSISALRAWQKARGLVPDGYASMAALTRLR